MGLPIGSRPPWDGYRRASDQRILPLIGSLKCEQMDLLAVEDWLQKIPDEIGQQTKQMAFEFLSYSFNYGMKRRIATFTPCDSSLRPNVTPAEIQPFTDAEIARIFKHVEGHRLEALPHLAFWIGARQGELWGLQWHAIDWTNGTIRIERQAKDYKGKITIKTPKTKSSQRTVALSLLVVDKLRNRQKIAFTEGLAQAEISSSPVNRVT